MNNKKIGVVLIIISLLFAVVIFTVLNSLKNDQELLGCTPNQRCAKIETSLSITHFAVGLIVAAITLGFYLIFFNAGEEAILKRLEEEKNNKLAQEKFSILLMAFDESEKRVMSIIKDQPGIEQNTLRIKTDLSKAKLSQILTNFEKKKLIRREAKNKTFSVYFNEQL